MGTSTPVRSSAPREPAARAATPRARRRKRRMVALVGVLVLGLVAAGAGWYVSGEILAGLRVHPPEEVVPDTDVVALDQEAGTIALRRPDEPDLLHDRDAVLGMSWADGYGQVGPALEVDGDVEVRDLVVLVGDLPPIGREVVDLDSFAFPTDPTSIGLEIETVTYPGPLGELEAWYLPGDGTTWVVGVHGRGADRHELLRFVDATGDLDYPTLLVRYRNDPDAPSTRGSLVLAGQREWEDVAAAVDHAVANGATDVVLVGASMGGSLVLGYLVEGDQSLVRGAVVEAPNADLREVVRLRSGEALPFGGPPAAAVLALARGVASLRAGLDFDAVDYVARAGELEVPVLVHHGEEDRSIPIAVSEAFTAARPDLVEFHPVPGGAHVRAWNEDPHGYATTVRGFLEEIGRTP
jgi:uncharacterized protein